MATSFTLMTPNANNPTSKSFQGEATPGAELVKSNKGRKAGGKYQKKQPQRGMGVAQLERLRIQERWKKMTGTTQFPSDPIGTSNTVPVLQGVANYGVPVMINGGNGGKRGWSSDSSGLVMQRVNVGNGGFGGLNGSFQVASGGCAVAVVEASKELSSMPNLQHCKPDCCSICLKKKCYNGENVKFEGPFNQFGQVNLPIKGTDFLGLNMENNQNINGETYGFTSSAVRNAEPYAGQININETVEVLAIHRKGNTMGTGSVLMEYEFFPEKCSRSTSFKEWEILPAESSVAVSTEASYVNTSNYVDLSLKLSY